MGQDEIIQKLITELSKDIKDECQVVFILSRIRKILDMKNEKSKYKLLNFYCNWSLHVNLTHTKTTQVLSDMFDQFIDCSESANNIARKMKSNHADFFKLNDFKDELKKFFEDYDLPLRLFNEKISWNVFIKLILEIIEECPVVFIKSSKKMNRIDLIKNKKGDYCYKFSLLVCLHKPIIKLKFKNKK